MQQDELTKTIIGCAYKVYNKLGFGFLESVYGKCLLLELHKSELQAVAQKRIKVFYEGSLVGEYVADLLVEDAVLVEIKSVQRLALAHEVQLVNYLTATGKDLGLLINFGEQKVQVKRKVRELGRGLDRINRINRILGKERS